MNFPANLLYHPEHTWAKIEGKTALVGITDFAQDELGDVVFVELPKPGTRVVTGEVFGTIESAKSVSELYSPVTGDVFEVNSALEDSPEFINDSPYGKGWIVRIALSQDPTSSILISSEDYEALVSTKK